jgi:sugar lactone lactonase YvrE
MQATENKLKAQSRTHIAKLRAVSLRVLAMCAFATVAAAQRPAIVVSQASLVAATSGGFTTGGDPSGGSFAVTQQGDIAVGTTYGSNGLVLVNSVTGLLTYYTAANNAVGVTIDSQNNLYYGTFYGGSIGKIPYVNGGYPAPPSSQSACIGTDTNWCTMPNPGSGIKSMAFDAAGDLFMVTQTSSSANTGNKIYELTKGSLYTGTPTLIYTDISAVASIALDSKGNLFFTDALYSDTAQQTSTSSALNELPYSGTAYATTPITLVSYNPSPVGQYDSVLSGVAVDQNNTVYFQDQSAGIFAFPNNGTQTLSASYVLANEYQVSAQTGYQIAVDNKGDLYTVVYNSTAGGPAVNRVLVNKLVFPASAVKTATTAPVFVNANSSCTPALSVTANENGATSTEFSGTAATIGACAAQSFGVGANFTGTLSFTPSAVGERTALLTVTNTTSSTSQTVAASGVGNGALLSLDPGVLTAYSGFTTPASVSTDSQGDLFVADSGANKVYEVPAGAAATVTPTSIGTGFSAPSGTTLDAAGNLYIADTGNNRIVEIPNISGTLTPASQSTLVASTVTFGGTVLNKPKALATGPSGALYIYDSGNNRIVTYAAGYTSVRLSEIAAPPTGTPSPQIAVDSVGDLYLSSPSSSTVFVYAGGANASGITPVTTTSPTVSTGTSNSPLVTGLITPIGVAVDPSGSILIADAGLIPAAGIVRVPNLATGTSLGFTSKQQITIESIPAAGALAIDNAGNLYVTGTAIVAPATTATPAVYKIARASAAINFGNVAPGGSSPAVSIYSEDAGNMALNAPTITIVATAPFSLAAGTADPCGSAAVAAGAYCGFAATFAPSSSTTGQQNGSATLTATNAQNLSTAAVALTGDAVAIAGTTPQVIVFTPPPSSVNYSTTPITLYAVASPSGLPITFTYTGPASISGDQLTFTNYGTVTVTASQAGNSTYAAANPVTYTIQVNSLGTAATPTFSLAAGTYTFVPQSTTISDTTPGAVIHCTTNGTTPTASSPVCSGAISITATETIEALATAPGYVNSSVVTAAYTVAVQPAGITVAVSPTPLSIIVGQRGAIDVNVAGTNGFNGTVTLSVTGLPAGATSTFSPATLAISGTATSSSVLTIVLAGAMASVHPINHRPLLPETVLAFALCFLGLRKRRGIRRLVLLLVIGFLGLNLISGCSSSGKNEGTTTTVTVTATSGLVVQSATFSLTVTPN